MSTRPVDSVFRVPGHAVDLHQGAPVSDPSDHSGNTPPEPSDQNLAPASDVEQVNTELLTIAGTIEELQKRLEQANARLTDASKIESTEFEIGKLFVEAQRFSEASLAHLETKINQILREAEGKATQILMEATQEAHAIRQHAHQEALASKATSRELQLAITGFTSVNSELLKELGALNAMLALGGEDEPGGTGLPGGTPAIS